MAKSLLNAQEVAAIRKPGYSSLGSGLYIFVSESTRSWVVRTSSGGKRSWKVIGDASNNGIRLAKARELASQAITFSRETSSASPTFKTVALQYIEEQAETWKNKKHASQWLNTLTSYAFPTIGSMQINEITVLDVKTILDAIRDRRETCTRVRGRIETILNFGFALYHQDEPISNPASSKVINVVCKYLTTPRKVKHHEALPLAQAQAAYDSLRQKRNGSPSFNCLRFILLTACRSGEARFATWDEVDFESRIWKIPGERMKAGIEHRVPLSNQALKILEIQKVVNSELESPYIFLGDGVKPISDMALLQSFKRICGSTLTVHGLRSSFRDWAAENGVNEFAAELCLAHRKSTKTEKAYLRTDLLEERFPVMQGWANFLSGGDDGNS